MSAAFDGAKVVAPITGWDLDIETSPPRILHISSKWLEKYAIGKSPTAIELEQQFRHVKSSEHSTEKKNGSLAFSLTI